MQKQITYGDILNLEKNQRIALINSVAGFKCLNLVGTVNLAGQENLAVFNSVVHIGANPPLLGLVVRPDSVERHSLSNILETAAFTLNHVHEGIYKQAHQSSARYPREVSEFEACGLSPEYKDDFQAPFVKESRIQIGLELKERVDISINGSIVLVGEIKVIYLPEDCWKQDGYVDLEKAGSLTILGLDSYHRTQKLARLTYAKPDKKLEQKD